MKYLLVLTAVAFSSAGIASGQASFLDRSSDDAIRIASYNLGGFEGFFDPDEEADTLFDFDNASGQYRAVPSLARVWQAIDADVWAFQEVIERTATHVRHALNAAVPLSGGQNWSVFKRANQVIASRYPVVDPVFSVPGVPRDPAIATVDLPDDQFDKDLHLINIHLDAGSRASDFFNRQNEADRLVRYIDDIQDPSFSGAIPTDTPIIVLGDYNDFDETNAIPTLQSGDIFNESEFGPDSPPDWDGTSLADPMPTHNDAGGSMTTFQTNVFDSKLDLQLYTDSVIGHTNSFILNADELSTADLIAAGLQSTDTQLDPARGLVDHLPVVVDYEFPVVFSLGDFDQSGTVDEVDIDFYCGRIGSQAVGELSQLDLDGDQSITLADLRMHVEQFVMTSNGEVGTRLGDANLDGQVDVLTDASIVVNNLGQQVNRYQDGDFDKSGLVDVLGDASIVIDNLGFNNGTSNAAVLSAAVPEVGSIALLGCGLLGLGLCRRRDVGASVV